MAVEKNTAEEEWSYSLALQAATWGSPLVTMYALRDRVAFGAKPKAPPNTLWRMEDISTPALAKEAGYVTPNVNVLYGFGFLDLRKEPILIATPNSHDRYYMIEIVDMWTNAFAYIGGKATGYKGGQFVLTGPGWEGTLPLGMRRIKCPTPWVLIQPRVHQYVEGKEDLAGSRKLMNEILVLPLSVFQGKHSPETTFYKYPSLQPLDPQLPVSVMQYKDPLQFWEILVLAMNENPPPRKEILGLLPLFKPLGIELGKPWNRSALSQEVLTSMRRAASQIGTMLSHLPVGTSYRGASIPPAVIGNFGVDYKTRAVIARIGLTANQPSEAMYWNYFRDQNGDILTGAKNYIMTFKEEIPFEKPGFWSITLYDAKNNYTVPNPLNRYMLGSDTLSLKKNSNGSFTIYIQKTNPGGDKESNWLPAPAGPFYLIPRSYPPKPKLLHLFTDVKAWPIPVIEVVP
jgi:DNA sulfur modification protein DndE